MDKIKSAEEFLKKLEEPSYTMDVMLDRIDSQVLQLINNYSGIMTKVKGKANVSEKDMISCSLIIGYLLKSHIDRFELDEYLNN